MKCRECNFAHNVKGMTICTVGVIDQKPICPRIMDGGNEACELSKGKICMCFSLGRMKELGIPGIKYDDFSDTYVLE